MPPIIASFFKLAVNRRDIKKEIYVKSKGMKQFDWTGKRVMGKVEGSQIFWYERASQLKVEYAYRNRKENSR